MGGTGTGKSQLGANVLQRIGDQLGLRGYIEVTVEADDVLDFSEYDHRRHAGVLLDGVGDALTLWRQRETLQGRPKKCRGGRSATMMYSYPYTLARRAVVATMDLTARNLHLIATNHWLKDPRNVCCLWLQAPSWVQGQGVGGLPLLSRTEIMQAKGVEEVAAYYEGQGAAGLAQVLQRNAVNGSDLLGFEGSQQVARDLMVSPFAARKLVCIRDEFLSEA